MPAYVMQMEETFLDYPDPTANAIILYFTGCAHHCYGCHSPLLQDEARYIETPEEICRRAQVFAKRAETNKFVFLGGDPLYYKNLELTKYLCEHLGQEYDICIFTGYDVEYVKTLNLTGIKYYKCGTFDKTHYQNPEKTDDKYVLASSNQNFYDSNYKQLSKDGILYFKKD